MFSFGLVSLLRPVNADIIIVGNDTDAPTSNNRKDTAKPAITCKY